MNPGTLARHAGALMIAALVAGSPAACGRGDPVAEPTPRPSPTTAAPTPSPTLTPSATPTVTTPPAPTKPPTTKPPTSKPPATPPFPSWLAGKDVTVIPTERKIVALTFDAGANADGVASILATLNREGIKGTFFLTGSFVDHYPTATRNIATAGHRLANHSVTHPHFPTLTPTQLRNELTGTEQRVKNITGRSTKPLFRFPYGDRNAQTIAAVNSNGYAAVRWTVDTLGWQGTTEGRSAASVTKRVLDAARPGEIVLMHVGSHPKDRSTLDADALPGVISGLRAKGYTFVTLDVLLSSAA